LLEEQPVVLTPAASTTIDLLATYRVMATIRRFEERCQELRMRDAIAGSIHLCAGQEAIPAATMAVLGASGRVLATYRGHGWAIACGVPLDRLLAEVCQRETGVNGGRGGSAYLTAPEYGFVGENSIVGAGLPIAGGVALAAQMLGTGSVAVASFGDGATSQGAAHEAIVFAAARRLPVLFVCENNGWSEMTPIAQIARVEQLAERAAGYGIPGVNVDGNDPAAVAVAVAEAAQRARAGDGPTFLECRTARLWAHYHADTEHYRSHEDREAAVAADPLPRLRARLADDGIGEEAIDTLEAEVAMAVDAATDAALGAAAPDPATARGHVVAQPGGPLVAPPVSAQAGELTYAQAVNAALRRELAERPETIVFGEDIAGPGGVFGVTRGLQPEFGEARVFDTPISESAILGAAVGAALEGLRPIVEIMWADFMLVGIDQLINQAANVRYLSRGERSAPLVVRCQQGVTPGSCAQHSQSLEALLCHIPGLKVGLPATPHDAYAMLRAAAADPDPCILIEARGLYGRTGPVDMESPVEGVGGARLRREGGDVAIVTWGSMVHAALAAARRLAQDGVEVSVLDLRWLAPLDHAALRRAVERCGRVVVVHEANETAGFGAEVAAWLGQHCFDSLDAPVLRVGTPDVRIPSAPSLQAALVPDEARIVEVVHGLAPTRT
jgi:2-oxoisovalerate dehydrogenase E1 component